MLRHQPIDWKFQLLHLRKWGLLSVLAFFFAGCVDFYFDKKENLTRYTQSINNYLSEQERHTSRIFADKNLENWVVHSYLNTGQAARFQPSESWFSDAERPLSTVFCYVRDSLTNDSLLYWSNRNAPTPYLPPNYPKGMDSTTRGNFLFSIDEDDLWRSENKQKEFDQNTQYEMRFEKRLVAPPSISSQKDSILLTYVALIPIKINYQMETQGNYFSRYFPASPYLIPSSLAFSNKKVSEYEIRSFEGEFIGSVEKESFKENETDPMHDGVFLVIFCLGLLFLGYFLTRIARLYMASGAYLRGLGVLLGAMLLVGGLLHLAAFYKKFQSIHLFSGEKVWFKWQTMVNETDKPIGSIYELCFYTIMGLWVSFFIHKELQIPAHAVSKWRKSIFLFTGYFVIAGSFMLFDRTCCILVLETRVYDFFFDFSNFSLEDGLGMVCIAANLLSVFLISYFWLKWLVVNKKMTQKTTEWKSWIPQFIWLELAGFCLCLLGLHLKFYDTLFNHFLGLLSLFIFAIGLLAFYHDNKKTNLYAVLGCLLFGAILTGAILMVHTNKKEEYYYSETAKELGVLRDTNTETELLPMRDMLRKMDNRSFHVMSQQPDTFSVGSNVEQLFKTFFSLQMHYDLRYSLTTSDLNVTISRDENKQLWDEMRKNAVSIDSTGRNTWYKPHENGMFSYLMEVPLYLISNGDTLKKMNLHLQLDRKNKNATHFFTNNFLTKEHEYKKIENLHKCEYALYKNGMRVEQNLLLDFPAHLAPDFKANKEETSNGITRYWSTHPDNVVVGIVKKKKTTTDGFIVIAYYAIIFALLFVLLLIVNQGWFTFLPPILVLSSMYKNSLSNRISIPVTGIFVALAFILGGGAYLLFQSSAERFFNDEQSKIVNIVRDAVMQNNDATATSQQDSSESLKKIWAKKLELIAAQNLVTLHLFQPDGKLIATSEEEMFQRNIISRQMNGSILRTFKRGTDIYQLDESIGNYNHKSFYKTIQEKNGKTIGYLQMPLYSLQQRLGQEIAPFFGKLISILLLLIILAAYVINLLANKIIRPINELAQRMEELSIEKSNVAIEYQYDDEIGQLAKAYNNQSKQIVNKSAELQVAMQKSTWRDMAKQVAHDINNALFPMKVTVQKAEILRNKPEGIPDDYLRRTNVMILQQISTFERLLESFRNMSRSPEPKNAHFSLNELFTESQDLFRDYKSPKEGTAKKVTWTFVPPVRNYVIFADKDILATALQNLLVNAYEAFPPERVDGNEIVVSLTENNNGFVEFHVKDNGMGIKEDAKDDIFKATFSTKTYGTGMGLFYSRTVIESMAGNLDFKTKEGKGSDFFISFEIANVSNL